MGVPRDHLGVDRRQHRARIEQPGLIGHLRVIDDLQRQIAQLATQLAPGLARDRIGDLMGLLDRVGRDRGEILLDIPGTPGFGVAQAGHDRAKTAKLLRSIAGFVKDQRIGRFHHCAKALIAVMVTEYRHRRSGVNPCL